MPRFMDRLGRALLASRPEQDLSRCVQCGRCASICPAGALVLDGKKLRFDYSKCIRCYCCHEFCPAKAIILKKSLLDRIFHIQALCRGLHRFLGWLVTVIPVNKFLAK
jgi:ferredoxin